MNIIQQQELARNSSEQQLIDLASQPNPSIMPPYLVTGELMRRKSIREKFAQAPQQSVSEEVLTEAIQENQPQGIGALTEDMATPMAAPQMPEEVMTESITETGIANLPAPNIGQNYAGGGIVYNDGTQGYPIGGLVFPAIGAGLGYLGRTAIGRGVKRGLGKGLGYLKNKLIGTKGTYNPASKAKGTNMIPYNPSALAPQSTYGTQGLLTRPGALTGLAVDTAVVSGVYAGVQYYMSENGPVDEEGNPPPPEVADKITEDLTETVTETEEVVSPIDRARERMKMYKEFMGEDPNQARIQERLDKMDARATNQEDQALNMAMIRGGLGMAGGQSQHFLSNLTEGFGAGVDTYTGEIDKVRQAENDIFALDIQMANAQRAEQIAGATYGLESLEAEEARNAAAAIQTQKDNAIMNRVETQEAGALTRAKLGQQTSPGDMYALYQEYINTTSDTPPKEFSDFQAMVMSLSGASAPGAGYGQMVVDESATKKKNSELGIPTKVTPEVKPNKITPEVKPNKITPEVKPNKITPEVKPGRITPEVKPNKITPEVKPGRITPEVKPNMMDKIAMVESSDRHMTDGKLTESPKGALGKYQIMPKTAANPGYGVKPIPDLRKASEAEHKAFAESYYQAMLKEFDGDEEKALAAYNGGVGRVKRAVAKNPNNWVALVPKESREYITKVQTA